MGADTAPPAARPRLTGYANGRARREVIVGVATENFAENGFDAATILEIAAACGISRAGLLHHFPDKEALLRAVLEERDAEDRARFQPYVDVGGAMGVLAGMIDLAARNRLVPGMIKLFVRLSAEAAAEHHPAHAFFVERYDRIVSGTARALRSAARAGFLRNGTDPEIAATRLAAFMDGLQSTWLFRRDVDMAMHLEAEILDLLTAKGARELARVRSLVPLVPPG